MYRDDIKSLPLCESFPLTSLLRRKADFTTSFSTPDCMARIKYERPSASWNSTSPFGQSRIRPSKEFEYETSAMSFYSSLLIFTIFPTEN